MTQCGKVTFFVTRQGLCQTSRERAIRLCGEWVGSRCVAGGVLVGCWLGGVGRDRPRIKCHVRTGLGWSSRLGHCETGLALYVAGCALCVAGCALSQTGPGRLARSGTLRKSRVRTRSWMISHLSPPPANGTIRGLARGGTHSPPTLIKLPSSERRALSCSRRNHSVRTPKSQGDFSEKPIRTLYYPLYNTSPT
jgi:hypothetical protein